MRVFSRVSDIRSALDGYYGDDMPAWLWEWAQERGWLKDCLDDSQKAQAKSDADLEADDPWCNLLKKLKDAQALRERIKETTDEENTDESAARNNGTAHRDEQLSIFNVRGEEGGRAREHALEAYYRAAASERREVLHFRTEYMDRNFLPPHKFDEFFKSEAIAFLTPQDFKDLDIDVLNHRSEFAPYYTDDGQPCARLWFSTSGKSFSISGFKEKMKSLRNKRFIPGTFLYLLNEVADCIKDDFFGGSGTQALFFVLTGDFPRFATAAMQERSTLERVRIRRHDRDIYVEDALTLQFRTWHSAKDVSNIWKRFQDLRREFGFKPPGAKNRQCPVTQKSICILQFVSEEKVCRWKVGDWSLSEWRELVSAWNQQARRRWADEWTEEWAFQNAWRFHQAYQRAEQSLILNFSDQATLDN